MRALLVYDGVEYTIPNEDAASVLATIDEGLRTSERFWLKVNRGEGRRTPAFLLVSAATPIAVVAERETDEEQPEPEAPAPVPDRDPTDD